jgi:hypothetical protein
MAPSPSVILVDPYYTLAFIGITPWSLTGRDDRRADLNYTVIMSAAAFVRGRHAI